MPINLYIDANVYLSLYHYATDDLEQIGKPSALISEGEVKLFMPDQTLEEVRRNRASVIADAIKRLKETRFDRNFPRLARDYDEYDRLRDALKAYERLHVDLLKRIEADALGQHLKADERPPVCSLRRSK